LFSDISISEFFGSQEFKGKFEDKMQKVFNELNKTAKIYDVKIFIFKNIAKGFLCTNRNRATLLTERSTWNK
jgi:hypothetical protein